MIDDDETDWKVLAIAMDDDKAPSLRTLQNVLLQHAHVAVIGSDWALIDGFFFSAASIEQRDGTQECT